MTDFSYASPPKHLLDNNSRLQRIIEEFRSGYILLETIDKGITYFGSTRVTPKDKRYDEARALSHAIASLGFTTITGGGPGIMEAVNRGAVEAGGRSIGFNIMLEKEHKNEYVEESVSFYYLFVRKVMLASAGHAYVFFPGGFGTLDEFFEISTLIHTHKLHEDMPVVLYDSRYWNPLLKYLNGVVAGRYYGFKIEDFRIWKITDTIDDTVKFIKKNVLRQRLYAAYHREQ